MIDGLERLVDDHGARHAAGDAARGGVGLEAALGAQRIVGLEGGLILGIERRLLTEAGRLGGIELGAAVAGPLCAQIGIFLLVMRLRAGGDQIQRRHDQRTGDQIGQPFLFSSSWGAPAPIRLAFLTSPLICRNISNRAAAGPCAPASGGRHR